MANVVMLKIPYRSIYYGQNFKCKKIPTQKLKNKIEMAIGSTNLIIEHRSYLWHPDLIMTIFTGLKSDATKHNRAYGSAKR